MKEKPKKPAKKEPKKEVEKELTPKQQKEKRREEARAKAAESRKIVTAGTAAWTGKLPAQLLNEYCQKLKWERVDYPTKGSGESLVASVVVGKRNPKTKQVEKARFDPPSDIFPPQKSALEARHMAATYGLHRIASHKNWKIMLPPAHRDLWIQLDALKAEAKDKDAWKWAEDPFAAIEQRKAAEEELKEIRKRQQEKREKQRVLDAVASSIVASDQASNQTSNQASGQTSKQSSQSPQPEGSSSQQPHRIRFRSALVMSRQMRDTVEQVTREYGAFSFDPSSLDTSSAIAKSILKALTGLGFLDFQVKEALEYSSTFNQALVWLLVHVPEDDLPERFMPVSHGSGARISDALNIEAAAAKIKEYGFSGDLARQTVKATGGLGKAMVALTHGLIGVANADASGAGDDNHDFWAEEMESVKAIYETKFRMIDESSCSITLENGVTIDFYRPRNYPEAVPGIGIKAPGKVPKYVLLEAIERSAEHGQSLMGDYMLLSIASWLEDNLDDIKKNPGKLAKISAGVTGVFEAAEPEAARNKKQHSRSRRPLKLDSQKLLDDRKKLMDSPEGKKMLAARQSLPAWAKQPEIVDLVDKNRLVLITGETGSGKSTQVVQFLLDRLITVGQGDQANIVCTQPRRISAIGVAQRVADERLSDIGSQVGYIIRGESKAGPSTQIKFVTSGVLLRIVQADPESLDALSHIVVDEVHERSLDSDFLLILLKRVLSKNKKLKIVLMSATVDPAKFLDYFKPVAGLCGHTHITGRTFPVEKLYLDQLLPQVNYVPSRLAEDGVTTQDVGQIITYMRDSVDYNLIKSIVRYIHTSLGKTQGGILIFLSGAAEIDRALRAIDDLDVSNQLWSLPLHASLSPNDQRKVFKVPPAGKRKVVVSTNVAETSITIPDIVAVIDSGRVKETVYDSELGVVKLVDCWTTRASTIQRMGRAGRVQAGVCYKLFTENIEQNKMRAHTTPEILRAPLESLYLSIKAMGISNVERFLQGALDAPEATSLEKAQNNLVNYGVLDKQTGDITPLGKHVSLIPADPKIAKLLVLASIFACLPTGLTVAAILSGRPIFVNPREKRDEAKAFQSSFAKDGSGDVFAALTAYEAWERNSRTMTRSQVKAWCADTFISGIACSEVSSTRRQLLGLLLQIGFVDTDKESQLPAFYTRHEQDPALMRALVGASLMPNVAEVVLPEKTFKTTTSGTIEVDPEAKSIKFFTQSNNRVFFHPSSILFGVNKFLEDARYISYGSSIVSSKHFISNVTPLGTYGLLLFSNAIEVDPMGGGVIVDKWTGLKCWSRVGILLQFLKTLLDKVLANKFSDPHMDVSTHKILQVVHELIVTDGKGK